MSPKKAFLRLFVKKYEDPLSASFAVQIILQIFVTFSTISVYIKQHRPHTSLCILWTLLQKEVSTRLLQILLSKLEHSIQL